MSYPIPTGGRLRHSGAPLERRHARTFADPLRLGPPEPHLDDSALLDDYTYGEMGIKPLTIPWYLGRIHRMDYDGDGRSDLVFWNDGRFDVHLQDEEGLFSPVAESFTTEVALDSDGEYSLQYGFEKKHSRQTALYFLGDLNGDGVADMVTMTLEGPGMLGKRTTYEVHLGRAAPGGTRFAREADSAIRSDTLQRGLVLQDLDGDGQVDLKVSRIKIGLFKLIGAFVRNRFAWDLDFYRMEDGVYPDKPDASFRLRGNVRGKRAYSPPVLIGDVDGDGRSDLLFGRNRKELHLHLGVPGSHLAAAEARGRHALGRRVLDRPPLPARAAGGPRPGRQARPSHSSPLRLRAAPRDDADRALTGRPL